MVPKTGGALKRGWLLWLSKLSPPLSSVAPTHCHLGRSLGLGRNRIWVRNTMLSSVAASRCKTHCALWPPGSLVTQRTQKKKGKKERKTKKNKKTKRGNGVTWPSGYRHCGRNSNPKTTGFDPLVGQGEAEKAFMSHRVNSCSCLTPPPNSCVLRHAPNVLRTLKLPHPSVVKE